MKNRSHDVDDLVDLFRGKIEEPREFFDRVMSCQARVNGRLEDRSQVVIPYRSVIEFYRQELGSLKATESDKAAQAEKHKGRLTPDQLEKRRQQMREINLARRKADKGPN